MNVTGWERVISTSLKQARDAQPVENGAQLAGIKELIIRKVKRRRWSSVTGTALAATTAVLIAVGSPPSVNHQELGDDRSPVAVNDGYPDAADPWVVASSRFGGIARDGWIPDSQSQLNS